jgi:hypothetical protein
MEHCSVTETEDNNEILLSAALILFPLCHVDEAAVVGAGACGAREEQGAWQSASSSVHIRPETLPKFGCVFLWIF